LIFYYTSTKISQLLTPVDITEAATEEHTTPQNKQNNKNKLPVLLEFIMNRPATQTKQYVNFKVIRLFILKNYFPLIFRCLVSRLPLCPTGPPPFFWKINLPGLVGHRNRFLCGTDVVTRAVKALKGITALYGRTVVYLVYVAQ